MYRGHYTAGDIERLQVFPAHGMGAKRKAQTALATLKDSTTIWSDGIFFTIRSKGEVTNYSKPEDLPELYKVVGRMVSQKANGRGGRRIGSGRKKVERRYTEEKKPYCLRLTMREHRKLMELLHELRKEDET